MSSACPASTIVPTGPGILIVADHSAVRVGEQRAMGGYLHARRDRTLGQVADPGRGDRSPFDFQDPGGSRGQNRSIL